MWVARIKIPGEKGSIGKRTKKFNVSIYGYPISSHKSSKGIYAYIMGVVVGEKENKKEFLKDWKKDEKMLHLDVDKDFILGQILESKELEAMYSHKFIHLKPIVIDEEGTNHWTLGSWDKQELIRFVEIVEKKYDGELKSIKQEKIGDFSFLSLHPHLTDKQKQAMDMAVKNGYYEYPRRTSVEKLARSANLSFSTFHAHLKKAEQKLLPFFFGKS